MNVWLECVSNRVRVEKVRKENANCLFEKNCGKGNWRDCVLSGGKSEACFKIGDMKSYSSCGCPTFQESKGFWRKIFTMPV